MGVPHKDNLDIPDFLKRTVGNKVPASEVPMASVASETVKAKVIKAVKPIKGKAAKVATKPAKAPAKAKAVDAYGYRDGSKKSQAAKMYAAKSGATLEEVKAELQSVQLNLIKDVEGRGFKVKRVKEAGEGKRQVTRYFLSAK